MTGLDELDSGADGARLLDELHAALVRYVVFPSAEAADAVTLWDAASHGQQAWEHAPRLAAISPQKRCGKSRLLDIVAETCHEPIITVNATVAAVARSIGEDPPTLLVDEADTLFGTTRQAENNEDLRGILNAGHQRNRPMSRWDMTARKLEQLETFAFAMLASIGDLPDTVMDRAVVVRMRRRGPGEQVSPYRTRRDSPPLRDLRDRLGDWIRGHLNELRDAVPDMPLEDREADTWEPLIAVADLAGGDWPARARKAAEALTGGERDDGEVSMSVRLLADLRDVFAASGLPGLHGKTILAGLCAIEDGPWAAWHKDGRSLSARDLAKQLRPYGVKPTDVRETGTGPNRKGYTASSLTDAWNRYLPRGNRDSRDERDIPDQSCRGHVADADFASATDMTSDVADVADVAPDPPDEDLYAIYHDSDEGDPE